MPKGDKYLDFTKYLENSKQQSLTLSFHEIESILGFELTEAAYKHPAFWSNSESHSIAFSWLNAGYKTRKTDMEKQTVEFYKEEIFNTFRPMRRCKQYVSLRECKKVLQEEKRGALSVVGDGGYPYTIPVNFYYDEAENRIYLHCAKEGHKIDAMKACDKVCFTVWNQGFKTEGNWEWNSTSVVAFGKAEFVSDFDIVVEKLRKLAEKYYPTKEEIDEEMASSAMQRVQMVAIKIEHMTGKLVNEK